MSAFEIMKRADLLDWHTLLVGLEHGWCKKENLTEYADDYLRHVTSGVDDDLLSIVTGEAISDEDLITISRHFVQAHGAPLSQKKEEESIEKWRFSHLCSLLESNKTDQIKIDEIQELYSQFGFPEDMATCSIYNGVGIDPIVAAKFTVQNLEKKFSRFKDVKKSGNGVLFGM
jgi:hypothetical protein